MQYVCLCFDVMYVYNLYTRKYIYNKLKCDSKQYQYFGCISYKQVNYLGQS